MKFINRIKRKLNKTEIRFRIVEFFYLHKLFGIHKKCWADLVIYSMISGDWYSVGESKKCGYCGSCMTDEERVRKWGEEVLLNE